ncbi:zinc finger, SWIM-type containing protein, partial [Tanacetum coccineum]
MSMNYEFDLFEDNMTASLNDQPSVNEHERARDDNNEPEETLVEGETIVEDEEDNSTEEGDSDSENDEDYFVDEYTYLEEDHDPIPSELDVIDNDNFKSGIDSEDDRIVKIRRKKLRQIKKANESDDNIVFKHFFFVGQTFSTAAEVKERVRLHSIETRKKLFLAKNDKVRIRAKCLGRIHVFTLDGEGPSNIEEVAPRKKTTKVKGKKDVGPSDPIGPNKKGVSLGGRGRPKPLAADRHK